MNNYEITRFAQLFNDELTLDNLERIQLVNLCRFVGIPPFGTDAFLASRLRAHLARIKVRPDLQHLCCSVMLFCVSFAWSNSFTRFFIVSRFLFFPDSVTQSSVHPPVHSFSCSVVPFMVAAQLFVCSRAFILV